MWTSAALDLVLLKISTGRVYPWPTKEVSFFQQNQVAKLTAEYKRKSSQVWWEPADNPSSTKHLLSLPSVFQNSIPALGSWLWCALPTITSESSDTHPMALLGIPDHGHACWRQTWAHPPLPHSQCVSDSRRPVCIIFPTTTLTGIQVTALRWQGSPAQTRACGILDAPFTLALNVILNGVFQSVSFDTIFCCCHTKQ